MFYSRLE